MDVKEAVDLVLYEGYLDTAPNHGGMWMMFRMGDDPGSERIEKLISAIQFLSVAWEGLPTLDRRVAAALWILGECGISNYESFAAIGRKWRDGYLDQIGRLQTAVELLFFDAYTPPPNQAESPQIR